MLFIAMKKGHNGFDCRKKTADEAKKVGAVQGDVQASEVFSICEDDDSEQDMRCLAWIRLECVTALEPTLEPASFGGE